LEAIPSGAKFASFKSIPYAEPPVGVLRLKNPVEKKPWTRILDATKKPPVCAQLGEKTRKMLQNPDKVIGSEDCLYLNVYVPVTKNGKKIVF
jgi:carboxylesterase type B